MNRVRVIAAISGLYDAVAGIMMLAQRPLFVRLFELPSPTPAIHADLNGIFLLAVAVGYLIPYRDPHSRGGRAYLWTMGPLLKGAGATAFVLDHVFRHSPASSLLFAASDGTLAVFTLWALLTPPSCCASTSKRARRPR